MINYRSLEDQVCAFLFNYFTDLKKSGSKFQKSVTPKEARHLQFDNDASIIGIIHTHKLLCTSYSTFSNDKKLNHKLNTQSSFAGI